jgi:hypothetical protein
MASVCARPCPPSSMNGATPYTGVAPTWRQSWSSRGRVPGCRSVWTTCGRWAPTGSRTRWQRAPCTVGPAIVVDLDRMATTFDVVNAEGDGASSSMLAGRLCEVGQAGIVTHAGGGYTLTNQGKALLTLPLEGPRWTRPTSTPNSCSSQLPPRPRPGPAVRHRRSFHSAS